jgi:hypothetical protein
MPEVVQMDETSFEKAGSHVEFCEGMNETQFWRYLHKIVARHSNKPAKPLADACTMLQAFKILC